MDRDGYLTDPEGKRIADDVMRERLRVRKQLYPQPDEREVVNETGEKIPGKYDRAGYFVVDHGYRNQRGRVDSEGYLLTKDGNRFRNLEMKERQKQRRFIKKQKYL